MKATLDDAAIHASLAGLAEANAAFMQRYPGLQRIGPRQPVHSYYVGAHQFNRDSIQSIGQQGREFLREYGGTPEAFAAAIGCLPEAMTSSVYARILAKLENEPIEDFRIDFEDGYGLRSNSEEDAAAVSSGVELADASANGHASPWCGIRIKSFTDPLAKRAIRTLDLFLTTLHSELKGSLPSGLLLTLPKVIHVKQVQAFMRAVDRIEAKLGIEKNTLRCELMIETPQSIIDASGRCPIPSYIEAAHPRCVGIHVGLYDYMMSAGVTASHQRMDHPCCDFMRSIIHVVTSGSGMAMSDGSSHIMPVPPHMGANLTPAQQAENRAAVYLGWRTHFADVTRSLGRAIYQGWDNHPAQLPTRFAAVDVFYRAALESAASRMRLFLDRAANAAAHGSVFDDVATGESLLAFFARGLACGALTEQEVMETGLSAEESRSGSFAGILRDRGLTGV